MTGSTRHISSLGLLFQGYFSLGARALGLAASPTFAAMAMVVAGLGSGSETLLCMGRQAGTVLTGMVPMYLLMSAFHLTAWLRLAASFKDRPADE